MKRLIALSIVVILIMAACSKGYVSLEVSASSVKRTPSATVKPTPSPAPTIPKHIVDLEENLDKSFPELCLLGGTFVDYSSINEYNISITFSGYDVGSLADSPELVYILIKGYVEGILEVFTEQLPQYTINQIFVTLLSNGKAAGSATYEDDSYTIMLNGEIYKY
jgi:hypothetical protein